jgi:hypothetical protein
VPPAEPGRLGPVPGRAGVVALRVAFAAAILRADGTADVLAVALPATSPVAVALPATGPVALAAFGSGALAAFGSGAWPAGRPAVLARRCVGDVALGSSLMSTFSAAASRSARAARRRLLVPAYSVGPT